jgi:imidazolonepropionase-like amidohydrolase
VARDPRRTCASNSVKVGMSPYEALKAATVDAAEVVGTQGEFGVIKRGARADRILLEANPLQDVKNTSRIAGVMVRGHWLSRGTLQRRLDALRDSGGNRR